MEGVGIAKPRGNPEDSPMMLLAAAAQLAEAAATPPPETTGTIIAKSLYTLILSVMTIYFVVRIWKSDDKR